MSDRSNSEERIAELVRLRLNRLEARVYLETLKSGRIRARDLSTNLGVNRVSVYRVSEIEEEGNVASHTSFTLLFYG